MTIAECVPKPGARLEQHGGSGTKRIIRDARRQKENGSGKGQATNFDSSIAKSRRFRIVQSVASLESGRIAAA